MYNPSLAVLTTLAAIVGWHMPQPTMHHSSLKGDKNWREI
jgi:hypothetical protein